MNSKGKCSHIVGSLSFALKSTNTEPGSSGGGPTRGSKPTTGVHPTERTKRCCTTFQAGSTFQHNQGKSTPLKASAQSLAISLIWFRDRPAAKKARQFPAPARYEIAS